MYCVRVPDPTRRGVGSFVDFISVQSRPHLQYGAESSAHPGGGWARSEPVANPRVGVWVKRCSDGRASRLPRLPAESQCSAAPRSLRTHQMLRRTRHTGSSAKVLSTLGGVLSLTRFAVAIFAQVHLRDCAKYPCQRRQTNVLHLCISGFVRLSVYSPGIPTTYRCMCRIAQY